MGYRKLRKLKKEYNEINRGKDVFEFEYNDLVELAFRYNITVRTISTPVRCQAQDIYDIRTRINEFIQQETKNLLQLWTIIAIIFAGAVGAVVACYLKWLF